MIRQYLQNVGDMKIIGIEAEKEFIMEQFKAL